MIKNVLVEVRERNLSRSSSTSAEAGPSSDVKKEEDDNKDDVKTETKEESSSEESLLPQTEEEQLLSLDYVHGMTDELAMKELESFKGVGPKSAYR